MRISDWSSDVCSSDLVRSAAVSRPTQRSPSIQSKDIRDDHEDAFGRPRCGPQPHRICMRSEEHTSELQSLMRNSYADFCLNKKNWSRIYWHQVIGQIGSEHVRYTGTK